MGQLVLVSHELCVVHEANLANKMVRAQRGGQIVHLALSHDAMFLEIKKPRGMRGLIKNETELLPTANRQKRRKSGQSEHHHTRRFGDGRHGEIFTRSVGEVKNSSARPVRPSPANIARPHCQTR